MQTFIVQQYAACNAQQFDTRLRTKKIAHSHAIDITAMHALVKIDDLSSERTVCKAASAVTHSSMCALSTCKTGTHIQIQAWSSRHVHCCLNNGHQQNLQIVNGTRWVRLRAGDMSRLHTA